MMWNFDRYGESAALISEDGTKTSYRELQDLGEQLACSIGGRCLVFVLCRNTVGSIVGYTSCINHDVVPLLLDAGMDNELLCGLIRRYKPDFIYCPSDMKKSFAGRETALMLDYSLIKTEYSHVYPLFDELALLLTTSGSTGSPKLVRQSRKNLLSNTKAIIEYLGITSSERAITTLPMSYTYGLSIINTHLFAGATVVLTSKTLMQKEFWALLKQTEATSFGGVPYTYEMLHKLRFFRMELPSLRYMTQAGGKLSAELHRQFAEYALQNGKRFIVMYGQTEATARMSYLPHEFALSKYGSMGIAIPGGELSLIDADGGVITAADTVGELAYRGDNVTLGYAESGEDLEHGDERGGMLITGDMAKRDADGFYYIVGRKKRFLKLFGKRVNLDECEQLLKQRFTAETCACAGRDDMLYAFITNQTIAAEAQRFLAEKLNINHAAVTVRVIPNIPVKDTGKTDYQGLASYYETQGTEDKC